MGDLSGKFGVMKPVGDTLSFSDYIFNDPLAVMNANYMKADKVSSTWGSIVFHCPIANAALSTPAIFCAKLAPTTPFDVSSTPTIPAVKTSGAFTSTLALASVSENDPGYFKFKVDGSGLGYYAWKFDLSKLPNGTLSTSDINTISTSGLKCM